MELATSFSKIEVSSSSRTIKVFGASSRLAITPIRVWKSVSSGLQVRGTARIIPASFLRRKSRCIEAEAAQFWIFQDLVNGKSQ